MQHVNGGSLSLTNVTIAGNSAGGNGGGVYEAGGGTLTAYNAILAGNTPPPPTPRIALGPSTGAGT